MKKKILYLSIPFIFILIGVYFISYAHSDQTHVKNNNKKNLEPIALPLKSFDESSIAQTNKSIEPVVPVTQHKGNIDNIIKKNKSAELIALFAPRDDIRGTIINYIEQETVGIVCAAFRLTDQPITKAFLGAHQRGVPLTFIIDKEGLSAMHSKILHVFNLGIPVYIYPPVGSIDEAAVLGLMHNKILLFMGQKTIITGSFNYTKSAQDRNRENIVIIKNNDDVFNKYEKELQIIMAESSKFQAQYTQPIQTKKPKYKKQINKKNK
jgi:phosphatidylserine/phosphatidylglycerophosphate/cardiolipin synthase-like enzyme